MKWLRPAVVGTSPSARCAHTTTFFPGKLFIYGGWNGARMLKDLYIFHTDTMSWSRPITTGREPRCRAGHSASGVNNKLFLFGGGDGENYLNDLHVLDIETMAWSQAYTAGTSPSARSRHTVTLINKNQLLIIGGGGDTCVYNDIYLLDTETMSWSRPTVTGSPPIPRWGHTANLVDGNKVFVFGGHDGQRMLNDIAVLDINTMRWEYPKTRGEVTPARAGHSATSLRINGKEYLFYFGGGDGNEIYNDAYMLDTQTLEWSKPIMKGTLPAKRCAHTADLIDDKLLLVFGGGDGGRRFKDIYVLDVNEANKRKTSLRRGKTGKNGRVNIISYQHGYNPQNPQNRPYPPLSPAGQYPHEYQHHSGSVPEPNGGYPILGHSGNMGDNTSGYSLNDFPLISGSDSSGYSLNCHSGNLSESTGFVSEASLKPQSDWNIKTWLQEIGLGAYTENFLKEEIDMDILPYLTETHLLEILKVPTLGARLRILNHAKNFINSTPPQSPQTQKPEKLDIQIPAPPQLLETPLHSPQLLERELAHCTSELKRLESMVEHLVSTVGYVYGPQYIVPPPPPPPQIKVHQRSDVPAPNINKQRSDVPSSNHTRSVPKEIRSSRENNAEQGHVLVENVFADNVEFSRNRLPQNLNLPQNLSIPPQNLNIQPNIVIPPQNLNVQPNIVIPSQNLNIQPNIIPSGNISLKKSSAEIKHEDIKNMSMEFINQPAQHGVQKV